MRLSVQNIDPHVRAVPDSQRPIRIRLGGLTYCCDAAEAITLATQLADTVSELNTQRSTP